MRPARFAVVVALALALSGCSSGIGRPVNELRVLTDPDGVQRVRVVAHTWWFDPNRVVVKANVPVELTLRNSSWIVPHNLTITAPETDVMVSLDVGVLRRQDTVRFTATHAGEYEFRCHVDGHARKGMKGRLVVLP